MATIYRAYHRAEDFEKYRILTVHTTGLVLLTLVLANLVFPVARERVAKVEIHAAPAGPDAAAVIALVLGGAARDVARRQVAEARILALEVVDPNGPGLLL